MKQFENDNVIHNEYLLSQHHMNTIHNKQRIANLHLCIVVIIPTTRLAIIITT
jgi:hypothetical protein